MTTPLRTLADLAGAGLVAPDAALEAVAARYAVGLTPAMAALIDRDDPNDPIARQFLPSAAELAVAPGEHADPIGDHVHSPVKGVVHRYPDRVLLKLLHTCPVYCRFCFRREMVGPAGEGTLTPAEIAGALAYVAATPAVWEVILTGGDPFMLSPRRLETVLAALERIPHVAIVRLHTRVPAVDPARVDAALVAALRAFGRATYVAVHANHPRELGEATRAACDRLRAAGVVLVSQSVLLAGVNDDVATLAALMRRFVEIGVKPYYLHHPDMAPGTGHFRLSLARGQALVETLRGAVSGLCQPTYVVDIPGGYGKVPVGRDAYDSGAGTLRDRTGRTHAYPPDTPREG